MPRFSYIFFGVLAGCIAILVFLGISFSAERGSLVEAISEENRLRIESASELVEDHLSDMMKRIRILSSMPSMRGFLDDPSEGNRMRLSGDLQVFSTHSYDLTQLRVLDRRGIEVVRMNENGKAVPDDRLQDKSDRYYFRDVINLRAGSLYLSPLDLNVEQGVVERPFKPTIRLALPLENSRHERVGVLVMNINASKMLGSLSRLYSETTASLQLVNEDGYWLVHDEPEEFSWGFMFPEREHLKLAELKPDLWTEIQREHDGSYLTESGALYEWKRLVPFEMVRRASGFEIYDLDSQWTVILSFGEEAYAALFERLNRRYLILVGGLLVVAVSFLSIFLLRLRSQEDVRRLQALHEQVLTSAELAVLSCGLDGTIVFCNSAAQELTGWSSQELQGQRKLETLLERFELDARAAALSKEIGEDIQSGQGHLVRAVEINGRYVDEWTLGAKAGKKIPVLLAMSPLRSRKDQVEGYLCVFVDITEQKRVQDALLEAKKQAEAHALAKSQFLANMSHEIRTPLNGVIGIASLLETGELDESQHKLVKTLMRSGDLLLAVINDILDYSKIEAGAMVIEREPFDLRELVENVLFLYSPSAFEKGLELINQLDAQMHDRFVGDAHRITQILANLLGNAVKFTHKGEISVKVSEVDRTAEKSKVIFEVSDTGIGMDPETQKAIFEPFQQAESSTTRRFGGTGLGLAIATNLVELMDGEIRVSSEPDVGTVFTVELVLDRGESATKRVKLKGQFKGRRAICVDDNATNLYVIQGQLELLGFSVETYQDPMQAYRTIANEGRPFDLLVFDYNMPVMDGISLARNLLPYRDESGADASCIMLSSSDTGISAEIRSEAKIDGLLVKPVSLRGLEQVLDAVMTEHFKEPLRPQRDSVEGLGAVKKEQRIIFADDDAINRMVMGTQLERFGLQATVVESGQELLSNIEKDPYDVVLLDCNMPDLDGYDVAKQIRQKEAEGKFTASGKRLWIIAATAYAFESEKEKAFRAGMDDYLTKPIKESDLAEVLARVPQLL